MKSVLDKTNLIKAMATSSTIFGTYLNMIKDPGGFLFWMGANLIFILYAVKEHDRWAGIVFSVYFMMSVVGLWLWTGEVV